MDSHFKISHRSLQNRSLQKSLLCVLFFSATAIHANIAQSESLFSKNNTFDAQGTYQFPDFGQGQLSQNVNYTLTTDSRGIPSTIDFALQTQSNGENDHTVLSFNYQGNNFGFDFYQDPKATASCSLTATRFTCLVRFQDYGFLPLDASNREVNLAAFNNDPEGVIVILKQD